MHLISKVAGLVMAATAILPATAPAATTPARPSADEPVFTIIPSPKSLVPGKGMFRTDTRRLSIGVSDTALIPAAEYLTGTLAGSYGNIPVTTDPASAPIRLSLAVPDSLPAVKGAYQLEVTPAGIEIAAADYNGIINGIGSLRQILPTAPGKKLSVPFVSITDAPGYRWRGLHLDSSRHFWTIGEVEQLLDLMALYKLSVFHWHLIDDQGWRVEIKRYPELTEIGAWRTFNHIDEACEQAAVNDPNMRIPRDKMRVNEHGDSIYGGFYSQDQLRHIVDYAGQRGIEVVPEFDVPGHSSMLTIVHPEVSCDGKLNSSICPGKDVTLEVCRNIFTELFDIFPSKYVHMGGDEVDKTRWKSCPDCARRMQEHEMDSADELQAWFVRQMELFFRNNGRTLIGWDEIAYDGLGSESAIMWWRGDNRDVVAAATAAGKHVTCTPTTCLYFDYPQPDTEIDKILALDPLEGLSPKQQKLINGLQANIWTEYIPTVARMQSQIFPRMIALAESAWNADPAQRLTVDRFKKLIPAHLRRFDSMGVNYQKPEYLK